MIRHGDDGCGSINVPLYHVPVKTAACGHAPFKVHVRTGYESPQVGAGQSLTHGVGPKLPFAQVRKVNGGQAHTVNGQRTAVPQIGNNITSVNGDVRGASISTLSVQNRRHRLYSA